jgi:hypothetical protein
MELQPGHILALICIIWTGVFATLCLFDLYRDEAPAPGRRTRRGWAERWDFSPLIVGGFSYRNLALVSMLGLFLELLLIRWISSEIRIFAYFKNFVLIACFLGFGLGCYFGSGSI